MSLPTVVEVLTANPELAIALAVLLRLARAYQSQLTWAEYRELHRLKRGVLPLLARLPPVRASGVPLVSEKGGRDDAEYQTTVRGSVKETVRTLQDAGASLHLLNSLKRRPDTHGDPLSGAHVVWTIPHEGDQVEGYLFRNDDGTVDLYAHTEASTDDPLAHLTGAQTDGDGYDVVPVVEEKQSA